MNYCTLSIGALLLVSSAIEAQPHDIIKACAAAHAFRAPKDYVSLTKGQTPFVDVITQTIALMDTNDSAPTLRALSILITQGRKSVSRNMLKDALTQATQIFIKNIAKLGAPLAAQRLLEKLNICLKYFGMAPIEVTLPVVENPIAPIIPTTPITPIAPVEVVVCPLSTQPTVESIPAMIQTPEPQIALPL